MQNSFSELLQRSACTLSQLHLSQAGKQLPLKFGSLYAELLTPHPGGITYAEADADAVACKLFGLSVRIASVPALIRIPDGHAKCSTCGHSNCSTWPPVFEALIPASSQTGG
jgi:hypothetical protein